MKERRIENYLSEGESIVWHGRAKENDVLYCRIMNMLPLIILWLLAECIILGVSVTNRILGDFNIYYLILTIAAILLHIVPTAVWFVAVAKENERINAEEYAVTESRIIIMHSSAHDSVEYIPLSDVLDVNLRRSLAETILGTGRIVIETDEEKITLYSQENAVKAFRRVYRAVKGKVVEDGE